MHLRLKGREMIRWPVDNGITNWALTSWSIMCSIARSSWWKAALSSSRFSPFAAVSSDSTRALKPVFASDMSSVRTSCQLE